MIILLSIVLILLGFGIGLYLYKKLKLILLEFFKFNKTIKTILIIITVIIGLLSIDMFDFPFVIIIHFVAFSLIFDLIHKFIKNNKIFNKIYNLSIIPLILTIIIVTFGYFNMRNIIKTEYNLQSDKDINLKIGLITDAHYGKVLKKNKVLELSKRLNEENLDLLLIGGDLLDENTSKSEMQEIIEMLGNIKTNKGIYYVYGNHDKQTYIKNKKYSVSELNNTLEDNNIKLLVDEIINTDNITIIGRNDKNYQRKELNDLMNDINKNNYIITMEHQPNDYKLNNKLGANLIVSGHTHAGQIFPMGLLIDLLKTSDMNYGYKKVGNLDCITSSGVSGWGFPIRTEEHSEYVIININKD